MQSSKKKSIEKKATLFLTYRCNLQCSFCYVREMGYEKGWKEMPYDFWQETLGTLCEYGFNVIQFNGGEPLYRQDFNALLKIAAEKFEKIIINTNGTILDQEFMEVVSSVPHKFEVVVSLDGHTPGLNDLSRGPGSFDKTKRMIDFLASRKVALNISTVVTRSNWQYLRNIVEMAENMKAPKLLLLEPRYSVMGSDEHFLNNESLAKAVFAMGRLMAVPRKIIMEGSFVKFVRRFLVRKRMKSHKRLGNQIVCCFDFTSLESPTIDPFGRLSVCQVARDKKGGYCDLTLISLKELLGNQDENKLVPLGFTREIPLECKECDFQSLCLACPIYSENEVKRYCNFFRSCYTNSR